MPPAYVHSILSLSLTSLNTMVNARRARIREHAYSILALPLSSSVVFLILIQLVISESSPLSVCPEPQFEKDQFVRVGPGSRFLYPSQHTKVSTPDDARQACANVSLEPALIESLKDFHHLTRNVYYNNENINNTLLVMNVDGMDPDSRGMLRSFVTNQSLLFHAAKLDQQDRPYFEDGSLCISIFCGRGISCHFQPQNCWVATRILPLCQYPETTHETCREKTDTGSGDVKLSEIGRTKQREYVGSSIQKSWSGALESCNSSGYNLLSFIKEDVKETEEVYKFIESYMEKNEIPTWMGHSWTSGVFSPAFEQNGNFLFKTASNEVWAYEDNEGHWEWDVEAIQDQSKELCLVISGENKIRPVLCEMKNFFVCFKNTLGFEGSESSSPTHSKNNPSIAAHNAPSDAKGPQVGKLNMKTDDSEETSVHTAQTDSPPIESEDNAPHHLGANIVSGSSSTEASNAVHKEVPTGKVGSTTPRSVPSMNNSKKAIGRYLDATISSYDNVPTTTERIHLMTSDEAHSSSAEILSLFTTTKATVESGMTPSGKSASAEALSSLISQYDAISTESPKTPSGTGTGNKPPQSSRPTMSQPSQQSNKSPPKPPQTGAPQSNRAHEPMVTQSAPPSPPQSPPPTQPAISPPKPPPTSQPPSPQFQQQPTMLQPPQQTAPPNPTPPKAPQHPQQPQPSLPHPQQPKPTLPNPSHDISVSHDIAMKSRSPQPPMSPQPAQKAPQNKQPQPKTQDQSQPSMATQNQQSQSQPIMASYLKPLLGQQQFLPSITPDSFMALTGMQNQGKSGLLTNPVFPNLLKFDLPSLNFSRLAKSIFI